MNERQIELTRNLKEVGLRAMDWFIEGAPFTDEVAELRPRWTAAIDRLMTEQTEEALARFDELEAQWRAIQIRTSAIVERQVGRN